MKTAILVIALWLLAILVFVIVAIRGQRVTGGPGRSEASQRTPTSNAPVANFADAFVNRYGFVPEPRVFGPGFGPGWDQVPAPTSKGTNRMAAVEAFVATNGWNMSPGVLFGWGLTKTKPIGGLPWVELEGQEFPAVTSGGILYVVLDSWHHDGHGIAYNPNTNRFDEVIRGFKPLGHHWYAWGQPEDPITLLQQYEGTNK